VRHSPQKVVTVSKVITSPIERFAGSVTIADPLTIPQAQAVEAGMEKEPEPQELKDARQAFMDAFKEYGGTDPRVIELHTKYREIGAKYTVFFSAMDKKQIPALIACVEKWELDNIPNNVTIDDFPASPRKETHMLVDWLYGEIYKVYAGEVLVPNALSPTPISTPAADITAPK